MGWGISFDEILMLCFFMVGGIHTWRLLVLHCTGWVAYGLLAQ